MGRSLSLFLMRATGIVLAGMLLFALFGHAHAQQASQDDNYGLKRFPGDNYDTVPPGAGIAPPPPSQRYAPVPGASIGPNGTYSTLNGAPQPAPQPQPVAAEGYQPVPQQAMPPLQPPQRLQPPQTASQQQAPVSPQPAAPPFGYRPLPQEPQQPQMPTEPYGYRLSPPPTPSGAPPVPRSVQTASATPAQPATTATTDYVLGPGDKLRLTVYGETDLSGEFTIDGSGYARLPLIGQTRAAGYTARQLEQVIAGMLSRGYMKSPRVSVDISIYRPFYVIGAVNRPGQYPFVEHMSAMNAVALAGGFNTSAVESVIFVRHEGSNKEEEIPVDQAALIQPGDVIKVHTTVFSDLTNWLSPFSGAAAAAATAAIIQ